MEEQQVTHTVTIRPVSWRKCDWLPDVRSDERNHLHVDLHQPPPFVSSSLQTDNDYVARVAETIRTKSVCVCGGVGGSALMFVKLCMYCMYFRERIIDVLFMDMCIRYIYIYLYSSLYLSLYTYI